MTTDIKSIDTDALQHKIARKPSLVWDKIDPAERNDVFELADSYKTFLDISKTEREAVRHIRDAAVKHGFQDVDAEGAGGKYYKIFRNKCIGMAVTGSTPLVQGSRLVAAHIDSPRLDLKQNPLYQDLELAFFKTHYYGGIRKYQWLARPLALHGTVITSEGKQLELTIGESSDDPVFTIADLLPHLSRRLQDGKKLSEAFEGEKLNLIIGSIPVGDPDLKERVKLGILHYLNTRFGMVEEDFVSAEIEVVPADKARNVGFDESLIGAYGQDDRICAFTALQALTTTETPHFTAVALFFDKEEIGSDGSTGAKSRFMEDFFSDLLVKTGANADERSLRKCLMNSFALSADVNAAMDPDFQEVHEKRNAARLGHGICLTKYTGSGGKSGSSDANAEYLGKIRRLFNEKKVAWQTGQLGKVDQGGGGTIAKFLAAYGMEILDCGPAILSMHSPFEIAAKTDLYMTLKAYQAFYASRMQ